MRNITVILAVTSLFGFCGGAMAQQDGNELKRLQEELRKEMKELREENKQLRKEVDQLKSELHKSVGQEERKPIGQEKKEDGLLERAFQEKKPIAKKQVESLYDDGFWFIGPDDKVRVWGWTQEDFRLFDREYPGDNTFLNRRTRVTLLGSLETYFNYMLTVALERSTDPVQFAWLEYAQLPYLKIRVGQFKEPFSLEELTSDLYLDVLERSIITSNFSPAQDIGAMVHGTIWDNRLEYAIGVFNGRGKNKEDNTDDKDIAARIVYAPFKVSETEFLKGLYLGVSGTRGQQEETLSATSFKTAGQTKFWTYNSSVTLSDNRTREGLDVEWLYGPDSIKAEWSRSIFKNVTRVPAQEDAEFKGWYISGSYLLTGEKKIRGSKPVLPLENFDPLQDKWGAVELVARYEQFRADESPLNVGIAAGTDAVDSYAAGINWILNTHIRLGLDYIHSEFDDELLIEGKNWKNEDLFLLRFQFEF